MKPRVSTPALEGIFQAAKWLKVQALLDREELKSLLGLADPSWLFPLAGLYQFDSIQCFKETFIDLYHSWIEGLKEGKIPEDEQLRKASAFGWTRSIDTLWLQEVPGGRHMIKPCAPMVQVQIHQMGYSTVDGEFRPMILSRESIFWGIQISFPQIYQDPKTMELLEVGEGLNSTLYQQVRRWIRDHTVATPMSVEGKRVNIPIRIGKKCFSWVNRHPQLAARGLSVLELSYAR